MSSNDKICVIAASNSKTTDGKILDYVQLASIAAERVKYYLGLPTFIITNDHNIASQYSNFAGILESTPKKVSKRTIVAGDSKIQYRWDNDLRIDAFNLTKRLANRVLMIDADYMIESTHLASWVRSDNPFAIFTTALDITGTKAYAEKYFPSKDIMQRWATAMCWDFSEEAEVIFKTAEMVRDNYDFYATMLSMPTSPFRNDVAFSIACHVHNVPNYTQTLWNLLPSANAVYSKKMKEWVITYQNKCVLWKHDMHVINKQYAMDTSLMEHLRLQHVPA